MANFIKDLRKDSFKAIVKYIWIPLFILGCIFIITSFLPYWADYVTKGLYAIGTTIVTSVVFFAIVKSKQFSEIFNSHLRDIVYCSEHLEKRKDIRDLWLKSSKAMYEKNFPELCEKVEENLEQYIPIDSRKYYEDYVYKVDIDFDPEHPNFIILKERESFDLVSKTKGVVEYKTACGFDKENYKETISNYELISFKVNKNHVKNDELEIDRNFKGNKFLVKHKATLSGSNKYLIEKEELKKYSLLVENTKSHTCKHIFNKYTLEVTHPETLEVKFYENGTLNNFEKLPNRRIGTSIVQRYEYKGIMFKNQGTRIIFRDLRK